MKPCYRANNFRLIVRLYGPKRALNFFNHTVTPFYPRVGMISYRPLVMKCMGGVKDQTAINFRRVRR